MSDAREEILGRIRAALGDVPAAEASAWDPSSESDQAPGRRPRRSIEHPVELFTERVGAYHARVTRVTDDERAIARSIREICEEHRVKALIVAEGLPTAWSPPAVRMILDRSSQPLSIGQIEATDGVLGTCAMAIAETGTIGLDGGPGQGRRVLSLLPDLHICVVKAEQIVLGVPAAIESLGSSVAGDGRPVVLVSGPSATSDIELVRIEGVHGPRRLEVILAG